MRRILLLLALLASPLASAQSYCPADVVVWATPQTGQALKAGAVLSSSDWDTNADVLTAICRGEAWPGADTAPATCEPPALFLDTDADADEMLLCCTATDTWETCGGGGVGGTSDSFATIDAPAGTDPVADSDTDTLTLVATSPVTITGDATTDTLTFALSQHAGTDVTADLEEEAHASEHSQGAADAVSAEALASACGSGATLEGDGAGGVQCGTDDANVAHATSHEDGGADELEAEALATAETTTNLRLAPDGTGGVVWASTGAAGDFEDLATAETDTTLRAAPDGAGGVEWAVTEGGALDLLHVRDEATSGTFGGTATAGAWNTRALDTVVVNTISGASLSSNSITLPAGTYRITARAPGYVLTEHRARLRDVSGAVTLAVGGSAFLGSESPSQSGDSWLRARITLASSTSFELQQWVGSGRLSSTANLGNATSSGEVEVYAEVWIEQE